MAVSGARNLKRRMRIITRNVEREVSVRLDQAADDLLERATNLAPQLSGDLIDSGRVLRRGARSNQKRIIYFDSPYAVVRHEDFYNLGPISSIKVSPDGPVGRKFLQRPLEQHSARYTKEIGDGVRVALRQSVR